MSVPTNSLDASITTSLARISSKTTWSILITRPALSKVKSSTTTKELAKGVPDTVKYPSLSSELSILIVAPSV